MSAIGHTLSADPTVPTGNWRVLRPRSRWTAFDWRELWRFRDLLWVLTLRDIQVRYKQTVLGVTWAVIQPMVTMVVLTLFFGRLLGVPRMDDPVFVYAGLLPWGLFTAVVMASTQSLVSNANMLQKVYFPRLMMPLSAAGAPTADFLIALAVLMGLMACYGAAFSLSLLLVVPLLLTTLLVALGIGIFFAALTVSYRDFRYVVPFVLQIWMFLTPVMYPQSVTPERYRWLSNLNPMAGVIEALRAAVQGGGVDYAAWATSAAIAVLCLMIGLIQFGRVERRFADVV